jgi:hypothetical protein
MVHLTTLSVSQSNVMVIGEKAEWRRYGRKRSWPNLSYHTGICRGGLRKIKEIVSWDSRSQPRFELDISDYNPEVLPFERTSSVYGRN